MATTPTKMNSLPYQVNENMKNIEKLNGDIDTLNNKILNIGNLKLQLYSNTTFSEADKHFVINKPLEENKLYVVTIKASITDYTIQLIYTTTSPLYHSDNVILRPNEQIGIIYIECVSPALNYIRLNAVNIASGTNVTDALLYYISSVDIYEIVAV